MSRGASLAIRALMLLLALLAWSAPTASAAPLATPPTFTLSPTFPTHTQQIGSTQPGQDTGFFVKVPDFVSIGWHQTQYPVDVFVVPSGAINAGNQTSCSAQSGAIKVYTEETPASSDSITLSVSFPWPAAAAKSRSQFYTLCLHQRRPASDLGTADDIISGTDTSVQKNEVYMVMGDFAPSASVSATKVYAGQTLVVIGAHWNTYLADYTDTNPPGTHDIAVSIQQYSGPNPIYVDTLKTTFDANGAFSVSYPISKSLTPGKYYAAVGNQWFHAYSYGIPFTVLSGSPPAGQPTATVEVAPTVTPTEVSATATPSLPKLTPVTHDDPAPWQALFFGAVGTLLVGGGVFFLIARLRRRAPTTKPDAPAARPEPAAPTRGNGRSYGK